MFTGLLLHYTGPAHPSACIANIVRLSNSLSGICKNGPAQMRPQVVVTLGAESGTMRVCSALAFATLAFQILWLLVQIARAHKTGPLCLWRAG